MALSKIKEQYLQTTVAFGSSGLPLGTRDDIDDLAIIALESSDPLLRQFFEHLPSLAELKRNKLEASLSSLNIPRIKPAVQTVTPENERTENDKDNKANSEESTGKDSGAVSSGDGGSQAKPSKG